MMHSLPIEMAQHQAAAIDKLRHDIPAMWTGEELSDNDSKEFWKYLLAQQTQDSWLSLPLIVRAPSQDNWTAVDKVANEREALGMYVCM
jgi:hypothetical protein